MEDNSGRFIKNKKKLGGGVTNLDFIGVEDLHQTVAFKSPTSAGNVLPRLSNKLTIYLFEKIINKKHYK